MNSLNLYMADGTYEGPIIMSSTTSKFTAVRVKKMDMAMYANELDMPGIYLLLVGNDSVYVGQSGLDTVKKRIQNTHSGDIDSSWHTVLGFMCVDKTISSNELLFMENAMCEYVHAKYPHCLTTSPSKANCNAASISMACSTSVMSTRMPRSLISWSRWYSSQTKSGTGNFASRALMPSSTSTSRPLYFLNSAHFAGSWRGRFRVRPPFFLVGRQFCRRPGAAYSLLP